MKRSTPRSFLFLAAMGMVAFAAGLEKEMRPNIIWIVAEDICPDLSCYGYPLIKTPNLDQLAAEGVRYTHAFSTSPVCSPTRSAFFTGMYQTSIGAHHHRSHMNDGYMLPDGVGLLSDYFREAGYFTLLMGPKQKTDFNFQVSSPVFDAVDGEFGGSMGAYHHGAVNVSVFDGPAWKQYPGDLPFFAQINFSETHRTFINDPAHPIDPNQVVVPPYYPNEPLVRSDWSLYLETIQILDQKIGQLMADLKARDLDKNTIVLFFGDHGRPMLRGKQWLYDGGIHVPLIVRWPGHLKPGTVSDELVSLIDLAPTSLSLAGIDVPVHMEGQVFLGVKKAKARTYIFAARDRCDETDDRIRCVRDKQFKYVRNFYPERPYTQFNAYKKLQYPVLTLMQVRHAQGKLTPDQARFFAPVRPAEELYDIVADPYELTNLADDPEFKPVLIRMRDALDDWMVRTGDQGARPEESAVGQYWDDFFAKYFETQMRERGLSDVSDDEYLMWWEEQVIRLEKGDAL